jgi:hypothetical protein
MQLPQGQGFWWPSGCWGTTSRPSIGRMWRTGCNGAHRRSAARLGCRVCSLNQCQSNAAVSRNNGSKLFCSRLAHLRNDLVKRIDTVLCRFAVECVRHLHPIESNDIARRRVALRLWQRRLRDSESGSRRQLGGSPNASKAFPSQVLVDDIRVYTN